jgi:hypothetical protein
MKGIDKRRVQCAGSSYHPHRDNKHVTTKHDLATQFAATPKVLGVLASVSARRQGCSRAELKLSHETVATFVQDSLTSMDQPIIT